MQPKDNISVTFLAFANVLGDRGSLRYLRYLRSLHDKNLDSQDDCSSAQ